MQLYPWKLNKVWGLSEHWKRSDKNNNKVQYTVFQRTFGFHADLAFDDKSYTRRIETGHFSLGSVKTYIQTVFSIKYHSFHSSPSQATFWI